MRVLKSEELINKINNVIHIGEKYYGYKGCSELLAVLEDIESLSFEDNALKEGRWILSQISVYDDNSFYSCSECGSTQKFSAYGPRYDYCPRCGAKLKIRETIEK